MSIYCDSADQKNIKNLPPGLKSVYLLVEVKGGCPSYWFLTTKSFGHSLLLAWQKSVGGCCFLKTPPHGMFDVGPNSPQYPALPLGWSAAAETINTELLWVVASSWIPRSPRGATALNLTQNTAKWEALTLACRIWISRAASLAPW